jgi:hypothetical protein
LTSNPAFIQPLFQAVTTDNTAFPAVFAELYIGGSTQPTLQSVSQLSAQFASRRVLNAGWNFYDYDVNGNQTLIPGYMLAALYAGIRAALPVADALTNKLLPILGLGTPLTTAQVSQLLANNVAVPMINQLGQIVISRGVTTSPNHTNIYDREESVVNIADTLRIFLIQHTSDAQSGIIGAPNYGGVTTKARIGWINGLLDKAKALGWIADFQRVTSLTTVGGNPEYQLAQITVYVPVPTNGMVYQLNLAVPVGL